MKFEINDTNGNTIDSTIIPIDSIASWNKIGDSLMLAIPDDTTTYILKVSLQNESSKEAWFDTLNLRLYSEEDGIIQENHYYPYGNLISGLHWQMTGEDENEYLYNSKEWNNSFSLNWYDYGWRWYDPQLGRWHVVDNQAEKAFFLTSYRYGLNNPIKFIDRYGELEVDPATAEQYPRLVEFLQVLLTVYQNKPMEFKNSLMKYSTLNDAELTSILTYGDGPTITVKNLDIDRDYDGENEVSINGQTPVHANRETGLIEFDNQENPTIFIDDNLARRLQLADTDFELLAALLLLESTIFHEVTHYGDYSKDGRVMKGENGEAIETGDSFEEEAYRTNIGRANANHEALEIVHNEGKLPQLPITSTGN